MTGTERGRMRRSEEVEAPEAIEAGAPALGIRLLGPLDVTVRGRPLPRLRSRKGGWLLAQLALRAGREVRREWLAETLWPDSLPEEGFASLRQSLADLRRALGPEAARLQSPTPRTLRLELEDAELDVAEFDAAAGSEEPEALERAAGLYRGPLLEGCAEPWVLPEREAREQAYLRALERLAARDLAAGNFAEAVRRLSLAVATDPLRQTSVRALMEALARAGEHPAAVEAYQDLRRRLHQEWSAVPDPETQSLYERVRAEARLRAGRTNGGMGEWGSGRSASPIPPFSHSPIPSRVPRPIAPLIGRDRDLQEARARLITGRLVTLTGPGGVGKTRLALEVAAGAEAEFVDGAGFVDLSVVARPEGVPAAVAAALGVRETQPATPGDPVVAALREWVRPRQLLLVLDNCEHCLAACASLTAELLAACPGLRVLATSRERLGLAGEAIWPVRPLAVEGSGDESGPAAALFLERARSVCPELATGPETLRSVEAVCRRLDGLPLALELAAALAEVLPVREIATQLGERLELLEAAPAAGPERHRSLRALLDWSWELLSEPERALLRRLSVFAGPWSLADAEAVCSGAPLARVAALVRKSLVVADPGAGEATRYRLLETVRVFAGERLEQAGEATATARRHLFYYREAVEQAERGLTGPEQSRWLAWLDARTAELAAALDRAAAVEEERQRVAGLALAAALGRYWQIRGTFGQGRSRLERLLALAAEVTPALRAKALGWAGFLGLFEGDLARAESLLSQGLALAEAAGFDEGVAAITGSLALHAAYSGDPEQARERFEACRDLWRERGDAGGEASALGYLGLLAAGCPLGGGETERAGELFEQSLALRREAGDRWGVAAALNNLGLLALDGGDRETARPLLEESLELRRALGDRRCQAVTLNLLGRLALEGGELEEAEARFTESRRLAEAIGDRRSVAYSLEAAAALALAQGDPQRAADLAQEAAARWESLAAAPSAADRARFQALLSRIERGISARSVEESADDEPP